MLEIALELELATCEAPKRCTSIMTTNVQIRLAADRVNNTLVTGDKVPRLFTPGEVITGQQGFMRLGSRLVLWYFGPAPLYLTSRPFSQRPRHIRRG